MRVRWQSLLLGIGTRLMVEIGFNCFGLNRLADESQFVFEPPGAIAEPTSQVMLPR